MIYFIVVPIILMSIIIHEVSHGYAAHLLGDDTAYYNRRLSLNPLNHIDPFGTILLPILLLAVTRGGLVFGYAKPVPINPGNFPYETRKRDIGLTAAAGPISNIAIAIIFSILFRVITGISMSNSSVLFGFFVLLANVSYMVVFFNLILAGFNLIPVPPLDGSKILGAFLPNHLYNKYVTFERQGMAILMGILLLSYVFRWNLIGMILLPPINLLITILTGSGIY